jgi:hypothetical protein
MPLIVNNISSSSIQINYNYLDTNEVFGYTVVASYTLDFSDISFENDNGVLLEGRAAIRAAYERSNLVARIGSDEFINGKITSLDFPSNALVGSGEAKITIEEYRRLSDYSSKQFAKNIPNPHLIDSFTEDYSFSRSSDVYSYTRNIFIKYKINAGNQFLNNAKVFLINFYYANRPNFGYQYDGISENATFEKAYEGKISEAIDLINLSVSLTENFESSKIDNVNNISKKQTEKISVLDSGFLQKVYTIELTALREPYDIVLGNATKTTIANLIIENTSYGTPSKIEKGFSKDSIKSTLNITFTTDPKLSSNDSVTYTCSKSKNKIFSIYTFNIEYSSVGDTISKEFENTKSLWTASQSTNIQRVKNLFSEVATINESNRETSFDIYNGKIKETITYTDNPIYSFYSNNILKYEIVKNVSNQVNRTQKIIDLNDKNEKIMTNNQKTVGSASINATATSSSSGNPFLSKTFLESKTTELNNSIVSSIGTTNYYITSDQIDIDLVNGSSSRVINYIFIS